MRPPPVRRGCESVSRLGGPTYITSSSWDAENSV
ncbi:hypothetical protein FOPG_20023 [Fusarium oxysporum f. sp. conglutinans race 2 54008]|uniref:Uncharacterized protein n=1 Tax=Fusarium oxysporum f. sp. conglutinans race 2 54008 TaxID=1089457 RepID=X0GK63_FUSOX|nr:hypothetical protein FOPG_20023 [Fusarium oxysporum f. sp. conglutinans race 2 54008]